MTGATLTPDMTAIITGIRERDSVASSLAVLQEHIVQSITRRLSYYSWTCFYMLDPNDPDVLVLGPFVGEATPHIRIPVSEGICGAAAAEGETVIVDDVNADPRYLSCSINTRSEIVVPIFAHGGIIGEIDIDSHDPAAFSETDRAFLEEAAAIVGAYVEKHSSDRK